MDSLRCMYELPYIRYFLYKESKRFNFPNIDIRVLEECLCDTSSLLFADICCRLLRHIKKSKGIRIEGFESYLRVYLDESKCELGQIIKDDAKVIPCTDKLRILKWLIDQTRSQKDEIEDILNEDLVPDSNTPDSLLIRAGKDSENRTYLFFDDLRLYRYKSGQHKTDWQCIATNITEWQSIIAQLSNSVDEQTRDLHSYLATELFPMIIDHLQLQDSCTFRKPLNSDLIMNEETELKEFSGDKSPLSVDPAELIKSENPELIKVLNEESSSVNLKKPGAAHFSQQNQLFVFSTKMANRAAEAVLSGEHPSIISYHVEDCDTKSFLQSNPLKVVIPPPHSRMSTLCVRPTNPYKLARAAPGSQMQWNGGMRPNMAPSSYGMGAPMHGYMNKDMNGENGGMMMNQPDISMQKVPDEILTPQQRQHREDGLASLRKIHEMLLADNDGQPATHQSMTDFSHINMAKDGQGPYISPPNQAQMNSYVLNSQSMYGEPPMSPSVGMDQKPPPPYPMQLSSPPNAAAPKKQRKRKNSSLPSPAPPSPITQPVTLKSEKQSIPPSPLTNQLINSQGGPMTPQAAPMTPQPGNAVTPQPGAPMTPQHVGPKTPQPVASESSPNMGGMMPPVVRQNSVPNFQVRNGSQPNAYHMLQAGQPTPYQNPVMGTDAPPSYHAVRRGMSVESITVPPSQRQQYLQPENQERIIERQLNVNHQSSLSYSSYEQQQIFAGSTQIPNNMTSNRDSITSASLANLAKGVEQNLSQMSQKGSFSDIPVNTGPVPPNEQPNMHPNQPPHASSQQAPSVNNTFVNAHMSIGQVNIQNVTATQSYQGPGVPRHMTQTVDITMNNTYNGGMMPPHQPEPMYKPPQPAPAVSIQNKGRNTIQYLPVQQPALPPAHEPVIPMKQGFEFLQERYPSPSPGFYPGDSILQPQSTPHVRHSSQMYSGQISHPQNGPMMPGTSPASMPMNDGMGSRLTAPHYMMSSQHSSMNIAYNSQQPSGYPGMMESHPIHMRGQPMMMQPPHANHMGIPAHSYNSHPSYGPTPPCAPGIPSYLQHPGDYMTNVPPHIPSRGASMPPQQMMMPHQGGSYISSAGPPYM